MSLFQLPQFFPTQKSRQENITTAADKVIEFVISLVNREDLIEDLVKRYEESKLLKKDEQTGAYISTYVGLEAFIIRNKPLIVKQEFTKEGLREEIRKQFDVHALPPEFRLLFLPEKEQSALIFEQGATAIAGYIIGNMGIPHLRNAVSAMKNEKAAELIHVTETGLHFDALEVSMQQISLEDLTELFKELYQVLLWEIEKSLSIRVSEKVVTDIFDKIRRTYDYDIIAKFLDVLPEGVLESERIRRLGRDELESKIQSRTRELDDAKKQLEQKLELIRQQNNELAQAKQALTNSLEEAHRLEEEIKKEKEQVEQKVKERTTELNDAMTSLQLSYQQIENEKARLLASINNLSLGFVMTDSDDKIIAINHISYQILKAQDETFTTIQHMHEYLQESININEYYQKCKTEKTVQKVADITFRNIFLRFFFTPVIINNNCIGVVIIFEDISEAKLLERSKDEFFAVASHELRTPLTAIRGFTSLILDNFGEQLKANPQLVPMITNVHSSSIRLIKIVNNFLDASKLEQGKIVFNLENFSFTELIKNVVMELDPLAKEKHIYLKFENSEEAMPDVYADLERVKQIVINLVGNAIKFTEKGGITIRLEKIPDYVKIDIEDTGLGISEEYRQLLFKKFQQAGERILTRDAATGSGMGLYISKLLIEAMNGKIAVEKTKLGEGSTFTFTLPIANKNG